MRDDTDRTAARRGSCPAGDRGFGLAVCGVFLATALLLVSPLLSIPVRFSPDYNEGWNALHAARLMSGEPLYPRFDALIGNNYPPLSFYAAGWVGSWLGDYLIAGRLLAFVGLLGSAIAATAAVMQLTRRARAALLTGLLLLGFNAAVNPLYVGLDDPQWLGHGFMLLGLVTFLASKQHGWLLLLAAALMVIAGFVKHLLLPVPLATILWLLLYRRNLAALWLACCVILLGSALAICFVAHGWDFFEGVFHDVRSWSLSLAVSGAAGVPVLLTSALPLILLAAFALPSAWQSVEGRLIVFYGAVSLLLTVCVSGSTGMDINAIFDFEIALCLIIGLAIARLEREYEIGMAPGFNGATPWALLILLILAVHTPPSLLAARDIWRGDARARDAAEVIELLAKTRGPVACEDLSLCYWAGKGFEIDFFLLGQKLSAGLIDPSLMVSRLEQQRYNVIQTIAKDGSSYRLPARVNAIMTDHYKVARVGLEGALLAPRTSRGQ